MRKLYIVFLLLLIIFFNVSCYYSMDRDNPYDPYADLYHAFSHPGGIAVDSSGNVYVADYITNKISKITSKGVMTTFAGSGAAGSKDGIGTSASFFFGAGIIGIAIDSFGSFYVANSAYEIKDSGNCKIRKISQEGVVTTFAGSGYWGSTDGTGTNASFYCPEGIAVDASGNVYIADVYNNKIRKITPAGVVTTFAGSGSNNNTDGIGTNASFYLPAGIAIDSSGSLFVTSRSSHVIWKITRAGVVTIFAGSSAGGNTDGTGTSASFFSLSGIAIDSSGNLYVTDKGNSNIRKITSAGIVTTFAGSGAWGNTDGIGTSASFMWPEGIAVDISGNVYIADTGNYNIRKITPSGVVTTFAE